MEIIQGEKFIQLADEKYIFYKHTHEVNEFLDNIDFNEDFILISHNSDGKVKDDDKFPNADIRKVPNNLKYWYSQNVCIDDSRLISIPIGMENSKWFNYFGVHKINKIIEKLKDDRKIINTVYINHNVNTNLQERSIVYEMFNNSSFCTIELGGNGVDYDRYINNIYNHKFVICPEGNGTDTHRTWETLYLGSIPIEKRNNNNKFYYDLPICFVDEWCDITEEFLEFEYKRITETIFNLKKIDFGYWVKDIMDKKKKIM